MVDSVEQFSSVGVEGSHVVVVGESLTNNFSYYGSKTFADASVVCQTSL